MVRVVSLGPGPRHLCPPETIEVLRRAVLCFHSQPAHESLEWLQEEGISCKPVPADGLPDGGVLAVPLAAQSGPLYELVVVVDRLLGPGGCPWDQEQTHESLKRHLLEEAYEVLDAIDTGSREKLAEELGDLILQPVMHAQMQKLAGGFDIDEVARGIVDKLVRRHPHVFGDAAVADAAEVLANWDRIKQSEKAGEPDSILAGVPPGMASLLRAFEVSKRAARAGFEWPDMDSVWDKLHEEERELREAIAAGQADRVEAEVGDLLFTAVNIARWAGIEPEEALRKMLNRFTQRFMHMEKLSDKPLCELTPEEWDDLWNGAKRASTS